MLLSVLAFSFLYVLETAKAPYQSEKHSSQLLAEKYAALKELETFTMYHGKESYASLLGKDTSGKAIGVLIQKDSDKIYLYDLANGISQARAKKIAKENGAGKIERVVLGYFDNQPIWEVKSGQNYYVISFENGTFLSKEGI